MIFAPEQTTNLFSTVTLEHTLRTVGLCGDFKREIVAKLTAKTAVTYFIMNGIEQPHEQKRKKISTLKPQ